MQEGEGCRPQRHAVGRGGDAGDAGMTRLDLEPAAERIQLVQLGCGPGLLQRGQERPALRRALQRQLVSSVHRGSVRDHLLERAPLELAGDAGAVGRAEKYCIHAARSLPQDRFDIAAQARGVMHQRRLDRPFQPVGIAEGARRHGRREPGEELEQAGLRAGARTQPWRCSPA